MTTTERIEMLRGAMDRMQARHDLGEPRPVSVASYVMVRNEIRSRLAELGEDLD
jgi:hypothetical protein